MSNNVKILTAFIFGAIIGSAITFRYTVNKLNNEYDEMFENEHREEINDDPVVITTDDRREAAEQAKNKHDITEYASKLHKESYIPEKTDDPEDVKTVDTPYVISPDEYGECGYETISLTYYSDGVLADENDELVDNTVETVGKDYISHFGEYEDDSVFIRNDSKKCDYEILRDYKSYYAP